MKAQPLRPRSLSDRLCRTFHQQPVEPIPHWELLRPPDLPRFDLAASWQDIKAQLARLALNGDHGDVVDRLVQAQVDAFSDNVRRLQQERTDELDAFKRQGIEHRVKLSVRLARLRWQRDQDIERWTESWEALCAQRPDEYRHDIPSRRFDVGVETASRGGGDQQDPAAGDKATESNLVSMPSNRPDSGLSDPGLSEAQG